MTANWNENHHIYGISITDYTVPALSQPYPAICYIIERKLTTFLSAYLYNLIDFKTKSRRSNKRVATRVVSVNGSPVVPLCLWCTHYDHPSCCIGYITFIMILIKSFNEYKCIPMLAVAKYMLDHYGELNIKKHVMC